MIYPIYAYGEPVLKKRARDIEKGSIDVIKLSEDMFETMYQAQGVGLAAPQIGLDMRIFVVDSTPMEEDESVYKKVFINPEILDESGEEIKFEEGCLSIPGIREDILRNSMVKIHYFDEHWNEFEEVIEGVRARVIQHEYDHLEGVLFTDKITGIKKRLLKNKLTNISKGNVKVDYRMKFPALK